MPVKGKNAKKNHAGRSFKDSPKESKSAKYISKSILEVNEPGEAYAKALATGRAEMTLVKYGKNANVLLIGAARKPENQMTSLEKMKIVHSGLSKQDLESLKTKTRLDYGKLAKALSVTRATLINKKKQQKFNAVLSERIMSLADIYSYGYEVFEDEDRFNQWMFRPNRALNGQAPYELMDNHFGREEVRDIIGRIAYGVYS